jgi:hypothetical protein
LVNSIRCSLATSVFTCTALNRADPHHLRDPARIFAVRLVDLLRRQQSLHVPRPDADHRQLGRRQRIDQPLRQRPGLDPDPAKGHT